MVSTMVQFKNNWTWVEFSARLTQIVFGAIVVGLLSHDGDAVKEIEGIKYSVFDGSMIVLETGRIVGVVSLVLVCLILTYRLVTQLLRWEPLRKIPSLYPLLLIDVSLVVTWLTVGTILAIHWGKVDKERRHNTIEEYGHKPQRAAQGAITTALLSVLAFMVTTAVSLIEYRDTTTTTTPGPRRLTSTQVHDGAGMASLPAKQAKAAYVDDNRAPLLDYTEDVVDFTETST
eukprot:m.62069 g.62069  ORF g.62069 m.62069 type:complete len:231 (-) comp13916_c0_seq4:195-887(-)